MKILVTGAAGYIGSHVCKKLKENGHYVEGWDNFAHGYGNNVKPYCDKFFDYDVRLNISGEFDAVVHLAGLAVVADSVLTPSCYYQTNIFGTQNVLENIKTDHFLFASTSSAWEMASPYAISKVAAEDIIKEKSNNYTIFRFFNVSGTDGENAQLGPATHLIRIAAEVAAGTRPQLEIFGTDYDTRDGTCIRDYIHVVDLANAISKAIDNGPANTDYECLGTNQGSSVLEVVQTMEEVCGKPLNKKFSNRRPGDAVISVVDQLSNLIEPEKTLLDMCRDQYQYELSKKR